MMEALPSRWLSQLDGSGNVKVTQAEFKSFFLQNSKIRDILSIQK